MDNLKKHRVKVTHLLMIENNKKFSSYYHILILNLVNLFIQDAINQNLNNLFNYRRNTVNIMDLQVLHVSQLYETVTAVSILILLIAQILAFRNDLWSHCFAMKLKQYESQNNWISSKTNKQQSSVQAELQKSAIQSLRKQMTQYESKNSEKAKDQVQSPTKNQQQHKPQKIQTQTTQLDPSKKSMLLFYVEYTNFMSEHVSIILSLLVVGMLTNSTRIYSLASFFCYLFASIIFDFLHLEERLKKQYKKGILFRMLIKILSSCFILGLFISYWSINQYGIL